MRPSVTNNYSPPTLPTPPEAPPSPPMFGSQANRGAGQRQRQGAANASGFSGTVLGGFGAENTSRKTLLGQ